MRRALIPAVVAAAGLVLAGCGGGGDDPGTPTTPAGDEQTTAPATDAPSTPTSDTTTAPDTATTTEATEGATEATETGTEATEATAGGTEPTGGGTGANDGALASTDGTFSAAVPQGWIDGRELMDPEQAGQTLDELGVDVGEGEIADMVGAMSIDQVPWIVFDAQAMGEAFVGNVNILLGGAVGDASMEEVLASLEQAPGFGETATGPRAPIMIGGEEGISYDYTLPTEAGEVQGRQLYIPVDGNLYVLTYTDTPDRFDEQVAMDVAESFTEA